MRVINYGPDNQTNLPVSGGGTALVKGALLARGATPGTNNGTLVLASGTGANPDTIGILQEAHPTAADTLVDADALNGSTNSLVDVGDGAGEGSERGLGDRLGC